MLKRVVLTGMTVLFCLFCVGCTAKSNNGFKDEIEPQLPLQDLDCSNQLRLIADSLDLWRVSDETDWWVMQ